MIKVDTLQIKEYENMLLKFKDKAFPYATRQTVNALAFETQKIAKHIARNKMITRNKFTINSIRVDKAKSLNVSKQESLVGSIADYMETQEFGATKNKRGKEGIPIATSYAAGQEGATPRTKIVRKPNKLQNIQLQRKQRKAKSRRQRNIMAIQEAAKSNKKYIFLELEKTKGIFKVIGGKKNPRIKMVYSLKEQSVRIPKNEWLNPATESASKKKDKIYKEALEFQLKKFGLFR